MAKPAGISYDINNLDPYETYPCRGCDKGVFPPDRLIALKAVWHKGCLKCTECGSTLNPKTVESLKFVPYCKTHLPKAVSTTQGLTTATAHKGAATAKGPVAKHSASNWSGAKEVEAAKAQGYDMREDTKAQHASQTGRDAVTEIQQLRAKAPAPKPKGDKPKAVHPSQKPLSPAEEIARAKAQGGGWENDDDEPKPKPAAKPEIITRGNVGGFAKKFAAQAAEPAAPAKPSGTGKVWKPPAVSSTPAPQKSAPPTPAFKKPAFRAPEPEPEPEPEAEEWAEEAPAEEAYEEEAAPEEAYEEEAAPAEEAAEEWAEEAPAEEAAEEWAEEAAAGGEEATGVWATAQYDYAGEQETDLAFSAGDSIWVTDQSDPDGWWVGELNGVSGNFPSNFVALNE